MPAFYEPWQRFLCPGTPWGLHAWQRLWSILCSRLGHAHNMFGDLRLIWTCGNHSKLSCLTFSIFCTWSPVRQVPHNSPGDTSGFGEYVWELQGHHPSYRSCAQKLWSFGGIGLNIDGTWLICMPKATWIVTQNPSESTIHGLSDMIFQGRSRTVGWAPNHDGLAKVIASEAMTLELVSKSSEHADQVSARKNGPKYSILKVEYR